MTPIASKSLGLHPQYQMEQRADIWQIIIDAKRELIIVNMDIVLLTPAGDPIPGPPLETISYTRSNSRTGDVVSPGKTVTQDNLKFDELRASQIGQGIAYLISLDMANFNGTPESIAQTIYTE